MTTDSKRPRALITGASSGIGAEFARQLGRQGYDLVLVARRKDAMDALAAQIPNVDVEVVPADLVSDAGVAAVAGRLEAGDIDLLVNNAGYGTFGEFAKLPLDRELAELDLNVRALMRLSHAAATVMLERKRGAIINVASTAAFQAVPHNATYAATKAFVLHFSEALHEELKPHGVTVTCLCPGPVKTEFQEVAGLDAGGVPSIAWTSVDHVVRAAIAAMRSGRAITVPGAVNMATAASSKLTPRFLTRKIAGAMFRDRGDSS